MRFSNFRKTNLRILNADIEYQNIPHTKHNPCRVCGGFNTLPQGIGIRCWGYDKGDKVYCSREQYGGTANQYGSHWLHFSKDCRCSVSHNSNEVFSYERTPSYSKPVSVAKPKSSTYEYGFEKFSEAKSFTGSESELYIINERKIDMSKQPDRNYLLKSLRHHADFWNSDSKKNYSAFLTAFRDADFKITGMQAIYLTDGKKANVPRVKKGYGNASGNAMYLAPPSEIMGITAGVENGLSVQELMGFPVVATLGDGGISNLKLPPVVKKIYLCVDGDDSGLNAFKDAQKVFRSQGLTVIKRQAPWGKDWNQVLKESKCNG